MIITKVNGKVMTAANAEAMASSIKDQTVVELTVGNGKTEALRMKKHHRLLWFLF